METNVKLDTEARNTLCFLREASHNDTLNVMFCGSLLKQSFWHMIPGSFSPLGGEGKGINSSVDSLEAIII